MALPVIEGGPNEKLTLKGSCQSEGLDLPLGSITGLGEDEEPGM